MNVFQKLIGMLCIVLLLPGCIYLPVAGPKSGGVAEKTSVEDLVGGSGVEVRRELGDPQWLYRARGSTYLIYQGWQEHGFVIMFGYPPIAGWGERRFCWLLEFGPEDVLQRVDRRISAQDCRGVFWTEEQMLSLEPGDAKTRWQLYAESADPGKREWRWLCQAADQGFALARHRLGTIYYYGLDGVESDLVLAYVWYSLAQRSGPDVKHIEWSRESLTHEQLMAAEQLISTWSAGRCEQELLSRLQQSQ